MNRFRYLYPLLLCVVPLFSMAAHNPGEYDLWDLGTIAAVLLLAFGAVSVVLWLGLRHLVPPGTRAALALVAVLWFYGYAMLRYQIGLKVSTLATVLVVASLVRARPALDGFARVMTSVGLLLLGWSGLLLSFHFVRTSIAVHRSRLVRALAAPMRLNPTGHSWNGPKPDIYLIILDQYAAAPVLREQVGLDNQPFEDSLRSLGFTIPPDVRSNYPETLLSLPSLLNFEHLTGLESDLGANAYDPSILFYLAAHNRAGRAFKAAGYTYVILSEWKGTQSSPDADTVLRPDQRSIGPLELERTELRRVFLQRTILSAIPHQRRLPSDEVVLRGFDLLKEIPKWSAPTFTVAHFMLPHRPYRFNSTCGPAGLSREPPYSSEEDRRGYRNQVECTNRLVLGLVHALLDRSRPPPIILLQSDHGSRFVPHFTQVGDSLFYAMAREVFGAFGAYYLPGGGDSLFTDRTSTVNVLRNVLVYYLGADLPRRHDSSYFIDKPGFRPGATGRFICAESCLSPAN